jgi:hypothetical protein
VTVTLDDYRDSYNMAPYDLAEFAERATEITEKSEPEARTLVKAAKAYLKAREAMYAALNAAEVTVG